MEKKFTLVGKLLTPEDLAKIPPEQRFSSAQTSVWAQQQPMDLLNSEVFQQVDRLSMLMMTSLNVQCPIGPHDDPGLEVAILRACSMPSTGKVGSVAVQCTQGHWAEYPCG